MAEFYGIFPIFSNVSKTYRGVSGVGGVTGGKKHWFGHPGVSRSTHNGPCHINRPQRCLVSSRRILAPHHPQHLTMVPLFMHCCSSEFGVVGKIPSRKADHLTLSIGYTGDG